MIKKSKDKASGRWMMEDMSLVVLGEGLTIEDAINKLCDNMRNVLIKSNKRGTLDKILDDQKE